MNHPTTAMRGRTNTSGNPTKRNSKKPSEIPMVGFSPSLSHPRQRVQARQRQRKMKKGTRRSSQALPTRDLSLALKNLEIFVPTTSGAQDALDQVVAALEGLEQQLLPPETLVARKKLLLMDHTPPEFVQPFPDHHLRLFRATYEANNPTEDRSTVVIGEDFVFAGVWDGHGGYQCSEYTQNTIYETFAHFFEETKGNVPMAFDKAYTK